MEQIAKLSFVQNWREKTASQIGAYIFMKLNI